MKKWFLCLLALCITSTSVVIAQSEKTMKRKVAVGRFINETQYTKNPFFNPDNDPIPKQAMDILSAQLVASGMFLVQERNDLEELVAKGGADMQKVGADYIILGTVKKLGRKVDGDPNIFAQTKTQVEEANVSIRLVEVSTGTVIYSGEASGYADSTSKQILGIGGVIGYDATLSDKAISAALSKLVENIMNKCKEKPWRGYVLAIEEGSYMISGGKSQGIEPGDTFVLYKKGKMVTNPQNGTKVEMPGTSIGKLTVIMCLGDTPESEVSFCSYEGQDIDAGQLDQYYIMEK